MPEYINGPERPERLVGALHDRDPDEIQELVEGIWRPAVPLPLYLFLHVRCKCGKRFWGLRIQVQRGAASERYERHYRAVHIEGRPFMRSHMGGF
jgi:hypothetical protein